MHMRRLRQENYSSVELIVSAIPEAMIAVNEHHKVVAVNSLFATLWGYSIPSNLIGLPFMDLWPNNHDSQAALLKMLDSETQASDLRGVRSDSTEFEVHISRRKIRESAEFPGFHFFSAIDISDHQQIVNALLESEQRLKDFADTVSDHIFEVDAQGVIIYSSLDAATLDAMPVRLEVGCNYFDQVDNFSNHSGNHSNDEDGRKLFRKHEPFANFRTEFTTLDGKRTVWLRNGTPKFDTHGDFCGYSIAQRDISHSNEREKALIRSEMRVQGIMNNAGVGIITVDETLQIESFNAESERIFGYKSSEMIGTSLAKLMSNENRQDNVEAFTHYLITGESDFIGPKPKEYVGLRRDGTTFPMELSIAEMAIDGRRTFIGSFLDISDKKEAESRFQQAQKMDAVGQMTGGIAHDFNNLLGSVGLNLELLSMDGNDDEQNRELIKAIKSAVDRGSSLTQRLLTFSRQQILESKPIDINHLVSDLKPLLTRTFPAHVDFRARLAKDLWLSETDLHQVENSLLNLCINARDAMAEGGTVRIETSNFSLPSDHGPLNESLSAGDYILITVSDTGCGIPANIQDRILEPFFTTKEVGKGTGLGLSMVYGFAQQSGGHLEIVSQEGIGTTVRIYLPRSHEEVGYCEQEPVAPANTDIAGLRIMII